MLVRQGRGWNARSEGRGGVDTFGTGRCLGLRFKGITMASLPDLRGESCLDTQHGIGGYFDDLRCGESNEDEDF